MYTLLGADLLAKRRDAGVSDESGVERVHALPRCVSCMSAAKAIKQSKAPSMSAARQGKAPRGNGCWDVRLSEIFHREGLQCEAGHESYL